MATTNDEILKLGELAKIEIQEGEIEGFKNDFKSILGYIGQIQAVDVSDVTEEFPFVGTTRQDGDAIPPGIYTQDILNNAPDTQDGFIKVKKIL